MFHHDEEQIEGRILESSPSKHQFTKSRIVVGVKFPDGEKLSFEQELVSFCRPGDGAVQRLHNFANNEGIPRPLSVGHTIPVLYESKNRSHMRVDEDTLDARLRESHADAAQRERASVEKRLADM